MIALDEDALICDFAETYHIYDFRSLPAELAGIFASGLRPDARINMKISGMQIPINTMLLASIADSGHILAWQKTRDGERGRNAPDLILPKLLGAEEKTKKDEVATFDTVDEWREWHNNMTGGKDNA